MGENNYFELFGDDCRHLQISQNVSKCQEKSTSVHEYLQMSSNVSKCPKISPNINKFRWKLSENFSSSRHKNRKSLMSIIAEAFTSLLFEQSIIEYVIIIIPAIMPTSYCLKLSYHTKIA